MSASVGGGGGTTPNGNGESILFANLNSVWRKNTGQTVTVSVPVGYTCDWLIYESETRALWSSGTGTSINTTFTTQMRSYDIVVFATKGSLVFERYMRRAITVLPPTYTEAQADRVINLATQTGYLDNASVNRPGYKVYVKGKYNGATYLGLERWYSNDPDNPVQFFFEAGSELNTSGAYCMRINRDCRNILIDGCGGAEGTYNLTMSMPGTGARAQIMYIETSTNSETDVSNPDWTQYGRNIWVCGVRQNGNNISSAGIKVDTANSQFLSYETYLATGQGAFTGLRLFNILTENTVDEGFYIGYVDDIKHSGWTHAPIVGARIYKCKTNHTGGDGMQFGAALFNAEIHNCEVTDPGYRNDANHKNGMQFSSGNRGCFVYWNRVTGNNLFSMFTGLGGSDNEFFSNVFINPVLNTNVNIFLVIYPNDYFSTISYKIYNNTLHTSNNSESAEIWNLNVNPQPSNQPHMNLVYADNLIVQTVAQPFKVINGVNQTGWITGNYLTNNVNAPGFVNVATRNYHLASLSSPVFQARHSFTKGHFLSNYDCEGVKFVTDVHGAYSGYELMT